MKNYVLTTRSRLYYSTEGRLFDSRYLLSELIKMELCQVFISFLLNAEEGFAVKDIGL